MPKTKSILLVEDEAIISLATSQKVQKFGYKVFTATSGEKAIAFINENPEVSLILMDINLGKGIDGTETAKKILEIKHIPIVFLTSHIEDEYVKKVKSITRYGYVLKNSTDFVLKYAIDMAFELFEAFQKTKQSEERLTKFIQSAVHGYIFLDENNVIQDVNPIALKLSSLTTEHVIGFSVFDVFPFLHRFEKELKLGHQNIRFEKEILISTRAKDTCWIHFSIFPVNKGLGITLEDITIDKLIADTQLFLSQKAWNNNEENFFELLMRFLCVYLQMDIGILGKFSGHQVQTLAHYKNGNIVENFTYQCTGNPCEKFLNSTYVCYPQQVQKNYLSNDFLRTNEIESIIGISLWDSDSNSLGFIELCSKIPIKNPEELKVILQLVSGRTVGEMERLETKISVSLEKRKLESYLDLVQTFLLAIDKQGIIVLANNKACAISEYEESELIGQPISKLFFHTDELEIFEDKIKKILSGEDSGENENYLKTKSGKARLMHWQNSVCQDDETFYVLSSGEDVTDKRKVENSLKESENRYKTIFEELPIAVSVTKMSDGTVVDVNRTARHFFSYEHGELENKTSTELGVWKSVEDRNIFVQELKRNGQIKHIALMQNKFGKEFVVNLHAKIVHINGEQHLISISSDAEEKTAQWIDLMRANDFLESVLNSSLDAIFIKDTRLRNIVCNQKYAEIVGKEIHELLGKTDLEMGWSENHVKGNAEEGFQGFENEDIQVLHGEIVKIPYDKIVIGDQISYYDTIKFPLKDSQQNIIGVLGVARDITKRKALEDSIIESESLFRALFEQAALGVAQIDSQSGKFIRINKKYSEIIGYTLAEIQQLDFMEISHPDELQEDLILMAKLIAGEIREFSMEKRLYKKDGKLIWVKLSVSPVWLPKEKPNFHIAVIEDITYHKHAASKLLDSKNMYESLVNVSPAAICVISADWEILLVSKQLLKLFDFENEIEVVGQPIFSWIEKTYHTEAQNVLLKASKGINNESHICTFVKSSGEIFMGRVEVNVLKNDSGDLLAYLASIIDVSKEIAYENQLKSASDFNTALLEMSPNAIFVYDLTQRKNIYSNHVMPRMLGYDTKEMNEFKTDTLKKIMHPDDYQYFIHEIYPKYLDFESNQVLTYEYRLLNFANNWLWFRANELVFSRTNEGKPKTILGVIENITDLKEKEIMLQQSESFFHTAMAESNVAVWKCTIQPEQTKLWFSPRLYELLGYSEDEITNDAFDVLKAIHPDDVNDNIEKFNSHLSTHEKYQNSFRIKTKDEKYKWFFSTGYTEWRQNQSIVVVGTIFDIDNQMEVEQQLQNLIVEKDLLLHEVHHRIKNNMSTIISLLQLQSTELKNQDTIDSFSTAINRIRSMMLLYDKLYKSTNVSIISGKEYLIELAQEVVAEYPNNSLVELVFDIQEFIVDSGKMSSIGMIINELITNAMKYAFKDLENRSLLLKKGKIALTVKKENQQLIIQLSDNGSGLPKQINFENETGFGLKFIHLLSLQINATIDIKRENGTQFIIAIEQNEELYNQN